MTRFVLEDSEELQRNKYRYCIHKDEMVVGVGRPWCPPSRPHSWRYACYLMLLKL